MGVFLSLDFFLFYVFWEVMLLPMYFLIGVWGGPRREYAAIKFFLYTLAGSVLMLIAMLMFYFNSGQQPRRQVASGQTWSSCAEIAKSGRLQSSTMQIDRLHPAVHRLRDQGAVRSRSTPGCPMRTSKLRRRSR